LLINIIGLFTSLRNDDIFKEDIDPRFAITLSYEKSIEKMREIWQYKDVKQKLIDANKIAHEGIAHYWIPEGIDKYNLRIPIFENYVLFALGYIYPQFEMYEFCDLWEKGLERGVGLCSQKSIVLSGMLTEMNIQNDIVGLGGHVVVQALVDEGSDEHWILDPDYGVVIIHDMKTIEENPDIVQPIYYQAGFLRRNMVSIYSKDGNIIYKDGINGYPGCSFQRILVFNLFYVVKWALPLILIIPFLIKDLKKLIKKYVWHNRKN